MSDSLLRRIGRSGVPLLIARLVLGGIFLYMGAAKALHPVEFMKLIREYHMIPAGAQWLLNFAAVTLPWVEMLCGVLLILGVAVRGVCLVLLGLLSMFTVAIFLRALGIYHAQGVPFCSIEFDCGCGAGVVVICHKLPENIAEWLLALYGLLSRSPRLCLRRDLLSSASQSAPAPTSR